MSPRIKYLENVMRTNEATIIDNTEFSLRHLYKSYGYIVMENLLMIFEGDASRLFGYLQTREEDELVELGFLERTEDDKLIPTEPREEIAYTIRKILGKDIY